uniref:C2H2-type domain-containing protein n=1 Tax=Caenorhabditis tropicalis TaxID=1561998 RepID=A0A1I7UV05_9PELO
MGKTSDALQKRYRNNTRVDPGSVTHFLCYYCGKSSSDRVEYQLHMLKIHEVMSQSYQLWSDHTMDSLGLRWSHQARGGSGEGGVGGGGGREDTPISMPASPIPRDRKLKNSEEDDEDYVYEEEETPPSSSTIPQRRRDRPRKSEKLRKIQERKRLEEKRRLEGEGEGILENQKTTEEMGKRKERRKTVEPIESLLPSSSSTTETTKRKRRRTDGGGGGGTRWKDLKSMDGGDDDPDVAAMVTKILVESKKNCCTAKADVRCLRY